MPRNLRLFKICVQSAPTGITPVGALCFPKPVQSVQNGAIVSEGDLRFTFDAPSHEQLDTSFGTVIKRSFVPIRSHLPPMHFPEITTDRLLLRPFTLDDVDRVTTLLQSPDIAATTLYVPYPYSKDDAATWIVTHKPAAESAGH